MSKITADFTKMTGRPIKPMHGIGQPPFIGIDNQFMHYLSEAGIPFSRLHDVGGFFGEARFVDIPNIFHNFDADESIEESYDFTFTDWLIGELQKQHCEPFYRLGVSIETAYERKAYRIFPPKDFPKWAKICEHIIRHYNEGWANGFHFGIRYWEIWNEPEGRYTLDGGAMWLGTEEEYFQLYEITANHLKKCFGDSIRVGGYASCGFRGCQQDTNCIGIDGVPQTNEEHWIQFAHRFLQYISSSEHHAPLDFFSWHSYAGVNDTLKYERYCRKLLSKYGYDDVEDILNEWNPTADAVMRSTPLAASRVMAMMLGMQKERVGILAFYDGRMGASKYGGLFNPDSWQPYLTYYALRAFNSAYQLKNEVQTSSDDEDVFVCGASDGTSCVLLLANLHEQPVELELSIYGACTEKAQLRLIDGCHRYTPSEQPLSYGKLTLPANGCAELRF